MSSRPRSNRELEEDRTYHPPTRIPRLMNMDSVATLREEGYQPRSLEPEYSPDPQEAAYMTQRQEPEYSPQPPAQEGDYPRQPVREPPVLARSRDEPEPSRRSQEPEYLHQSRESARSHSNIREPERSHHKTTQEPVLSHSHRSRSSEHERMQQEYEREHQRELQREREREIRQGRGVRNRPRQVARMPSITSDGSYVDPPDWLESPTPVMRGSFEIQDAPEIEKKKGELEAKLEEAAEKLPPRDQGQPNGGLMAWLQVLAGFSIMFNTWGMLNTFGIFQTYYSSNTIFTESSSNISWIGAIQAYLVVSFGLLSGPLFDRGYLRHLLAVGSFMVVFGFMMLSISKTYWQVLLAQGFCVGIGGGLIYSPALAILPTYFSTKIGAAIGLAASGSSLGGIIYPIVFYKLIDRIGFGWTVRTIAFMALATLTIPIVFMRMRVKPSNPRSVLDWTALTDWPVVFFVWAALIGFAGLYVMQFYLSLYGLTKGFTDSSLSFYLIPILNSASVFGRTIPSAMSDYVGPLNLFAPAAVLCAVMVFTMIRVSNAAGMVLIAGFYGFFSGVFVALPPVCLVRLTADKSKVGTRLGMAFAFAAFGMLAGGPGGGKVLGNNAMDLHWNLTWVYGGIMSAVSAGMLCCLRFYLAGGKLVAKV